MRRLLQTSRLSSIICAHKPDRKPTSLQVQPIAATRLLLRSFHRGSKTAGAFLVSVIKISASSRAIRYQVKAAGAAGPPEGAVDGRAF